ncbi:WhiB family transcriptional regulator, redox-sensing transcriptional regulator [Candidatus Hakubella thermalkaliphila]|nr:WhiB family transcriptional regulator, redox-sensing transcriptional regulator [Candidatus Hakubella thermalkaliphila]
MEKGKVALMTGSTIHWRKRARCIGTDPNTFFNEDPSPALEICEDCEVRTECLEFALQYKIDFGVWGGTIPSQRKKLLLMKSAS